MKKINLNDYSQSLTPIIGKNPQYLILGTMPGKESLRHQQYYAHSSNTFWQILFHLFNTNIEDNYNDKVTFLLNNKIALWDVCRFCYRKGSLDSDIQKEIPNDIPNFIGQNPTINKIIFNGQKAEKLYKKHFEFLNNIEYFTVLSSSPANAVFTFEQKLENWELAIFN